MAYSKEKLAFLRENTMLSPVAAIKLKNLQKNGSDVEKLLEMEYDMRLTTYANRYYKMWKSMNWGEREDESLQSFAEGTIDQEISAKEEKSR